MKNKTSIRLENITKKYPQGESTINVLNQLNGHFDPGTSYAITGASGSGKSTLLNLLAGLDTPTDGNIFFNNQDITHLTNAEKSHFLTFKVGLVFQNPHLIQELTIVENVMLPGLIARMADHEVTQRAMDLLRQVGLGNKTNHQPSQLSGGQQQRAALARALFNKPPFLLADEPTGNLDPQTAQQIIDLLLACQQEWHMGIIVSSHDETLAAQMNKVYELLEGKLVLKR